MWLVPPHSLSLCFGDEARLDWKGITKLFCFDLVNTFGNSLEFDSSQCDMQLFYSKQKYYLERNMSNIPLKKFCTMRYKIQICILAVGYWTLYAVSVINVQQIKYFVSKYIIFFHVHSSNCHPNTSLESLQCVPVCRGVMFTHPIYERSLFLPRSFRWLAASSSLYSD